MFINCLYCFVDFLAGGMLTELLAGAQEDCSLTVEQTSNYPHCKGKMDVSRVLFNKFAIY